MYFEGPSGAGGTCLLPGPQNIGSPEGSRTLGSSSGTGQPHCSVRHERALGERTQPWRAALSSKFCTEDFTDCHILITQENASMIALLIAAILLRPIPQGIPKDQAVSLRLFLSGFQKKVGVAPFVVEPGQHVSFSNVKDWSQAKITLIRTAGAFMHTPQYTLEVHGDGSVLFDGQGLVAFVGKHRGAIPQQNVDELIELLKQADLYSLPFGHHPNGEGPGANVSVVVNGPGTQSLAVTAMALHLLPTGEQLEDAIDRLAGSERWVKGNAETLAALEAERWDFKSHAAANALARLAALGNSQVALDLVHAGVPLDGNVRHDGGKCLLPAARICRTPRRPKADTSPAQSRS
jgi:hypothetical protein